MKKLLFIYAALSLFLFSNLPVIASHSIGGEITYRWIAGNNYYVTLTFYRDCAGVQAPTTLSIDVASASCGSSFSAPLDFISTTEVTPICSGSNLTYCNGGFLAGVEQYIFADTVSLTISCSDWVFSYSLCCRNAAITNLMNPGSMNIYYETTLDNLNTPFNNSVEFINIASSFIYVGQPHQLSFAAFDIDGDSLAYSLTSPLGSGGIALQFIPPFSLAQPISSNPPPALNPVSGIFTVNPTAIEVAVMAAKVTEYRNGVEIGSVTRDIQINVISQANNLPTSTGIDSTSSFTTFICANDTLTFTLHAHDQEPGQTASYSFVSDLPGASFVIDSSGQHEVLHYSWPTNASLVSAFPYELIVTVKDGACTYYGEQNYAFLLYVTNCAQPDSVWPGDANYDGVANVVDILPIGIGYNAVGSVRANASNNWLPQASNDWVQVFNSGVNYKHADCNGDGLIDNLDLSPITLNYGLTHNKTQQTGGGGVEFFIDILEDSIVAGGTVHAEIHLGTVLNPANNVYGVAMSLAYDEFLVKDASSTVDLSNTWLGTAGTDLLNFTKQDDSLGIFDIAEVRTDQNNASGNGLLGTISFVMQDDITGKDIIAEPFSVIVQNLKVIAFDESDIAVNITSDMTIVYQETNPNSVEHSLFQTFEIFPNPTQNALCLNVLGEDIEYFSIFNSAGVKTASIKIENEKYVFINLSGYAQGVYFIVTHNYLNEATGLQKFVRQ